jgi:hypothetical protein
MGTWQIRTGSPVDAGAAIFSGISLPPGADGTRTWTFPSEPFLYLDGGGTPVNIVDLPGSFTFGAAWTCDLNGSILADAGGSTLRLQLSGLGIDSTQNGLGTIGTFSGGGITAGVLSALATTSAIATGHAVLSGGANPAQSVNGSVVTVSGTYTGTSTGVTRVRPSSGSVNGGQSVTIHGVGFTGAPGATIGGVALTSFVVVDDTTITGVTGEHASGVVDVVVTSVGTLTGGYTYIIPTTFSLKPLPVRVPIQQGGGKRG